MPSTWSGLLSLIHKYPVQGNTPVLVIHLNGLTSIQFPEKININDKILRTLSELFLRTNDLNLLLLEEENFDLAQLFQLSCAYLRQLLTF